MHKIEKEQNLPRERLETVWVFSTYMPIWKIIRKLTRHKHYFSDPPELADPGISVTEAEVAVHTPVNFTCLVSHPGNPELHTYTWTKRNSSFLHTSSDHVFPFSPKSVLESGQYSCQATNAIDNSTPSSLQTFTVRGEKSKVHVTLSKYRYIL